MVAPGKLLPPSARDFEAYQLLHVEGSSTRQVAGQLKISQTRVCQVASKVAQFLVEVLPEQVQTQSRQQRQKLLCVAEQIAAARVNHLYGQALRGWEQSQGMQTTHREVQTGLRGGAKIVTSRKSVGDCRYLTTAAKLALIGSRLPASQLAYLCGEVTEEDEAQQMDRQDVVAENEALAESQRIPPVVECSPAVVNRSAALFDVSPTSSVSLYDAEDWEDDAPLFEMTEEDDSAPVQLTRQQRRARQRLLQRKLKKAK